MASTVQLSAASSVGPTQLIDLILNTDEDAPDFDLQHLVATIDSLLAHYNTNLAKRGSTRQKFVSMIDVLPSASDAAIFSEDVSRNVQIIATQISKYSGDKYSTAIAVLNAAVNVHWVGVGFLLVATVLERLDTINNNKMECFKLLNCMNKSAKVIMQLKGFPRTKVKMQTQINESIGLIVKGAILCCSQKKSKTFKRFYNASKDRDDLKLLRSEVKEMYKILNQEISVQSLSILENSLICNPPHVPNVDYAVGLKQQIDEVVKLLEWENDKPAVAVVIHGIGGSGKTTLADAVYASLKDKLQGWRYSKITLIQSLERLPNVEQPQSLILQHLTGIKQDVRDFQSGRQRLKDIMQKESIFLYIDNALFKEPLQKLLPKDVTSPKKLRLLLTAKENNVAGIIEGCRIPCEIYPMECLPFDAALQVLCRNIDRERDSNIILQERPQAKEITEKCSCCPLFLEVVGTYLHKRKNTVEAYERVLRWLQCGEDFSGNKNDSFDEERILFAYKGLRQSSQEAFLDICSFFNDWEWDEVSCILGEEALESLEEGALLKRNRNRISIPDLILSVGRNKSRHSRFTNADHLSGCLKNEELRCQIKGIWLNSNQSPFHISAQELDAMSGSLRILVMGNRSIVEGKCNRQFDELRFLQVGRAPNLPIDILKLKSLTYIDYSFEKEMILSPSKNLSSLEVLKFQKHIGSHTIGIPEFPRINKLKQLVMTGWDTAEIPRSFVRLHNLKTLKLFRCLVLKELPESLGKLQFLQVLHLNGCTSLKQLPAEFVKLPALTTLNLAGCQSLKQLPAEFEKLTALTTLDLEGCENLKQLPAGFGKLTSLTVFTLCGCKSLEGLPCELENLSSLQSFNLRGCSSLPALPERMGNLTSLSFLDLDGCEKLSSLPPSLGQLTNLANSHISFSNCSSLTALPEEFCKLTMLNSFSVSKCSSLQMLPSRFGELTSIQELNLNECENLQELCKDFHYLVGLRKLNMSKCRSLLGLPQGFGKLRCLKKLKLSDCDKLEELCSDFHRLQALKKLKLSGCNSLSTLPDCFGQLGSLETLHLSRCSKLEKLSWDFQCLPSLIELDLSHCESLGEKWMDSVGDIKSLWRVDIGGSKRMIQRWMEMQTKQEEWHLVVVTSSSEIENGQKALTLRAILSKLFDEGLLNDVHQQPFCSSSLLPDAPVIMILDKDEEKYFQSWKWELLERNLQQLEFNSKAFQIVYVGREFNALPPEVADRIIAYTPLNSRTSKFFKNLLSIFRPSGTSVFLHTESLEDTHIKHLSSWEDISYIFDEVTFLTRTPRESNIDLLRALLVTQETDYLLKNNQHVKVNDLRGKVVLLLITFLSISEITISALKDTYFKMRDNHGFETEVVWIPIAESSWVGYERAVENAPWPVVPNPWSLNFFTFYRIIEPKPIPVAAVVDPKGNISCKDALPMIERWGMDAYPFSQSREEELRKLEWEGVKLTPQSSLEFLFKNLEFIPSKAKEAMAAREMILLCVSSFEQMLDFMSQLNCALKMFKTGVHVFYIASPPTEENKNYTQQGKEEIKYEKNRKEMHTISSFSVLSDVYRFWRRVKHLCNDAMTMGVDEKIVQVRRMVLGLASAGVESGKEMGIKIMVVDEFGEMVSGRGKEIVELLCQGEEGSHENFLKGLKIEKLQQLLDRTWTNGIIHGKHHPGHPLVEINGQYNGTTSGCSLCCQQIYRVRPCYQCIVCESYGICEKCS